MPSRVVAISRLVYERNAIACFGQVDESVAVQLEPCGVPAGVLVGGPVHVAELDLRGGAIGADVERERQFQDLLGLVPVQVEVKFDTAASGCQSHGLRDRRGTEGPVDPNRTNQRARFDDGERVALSYVNMPVQIVPIDVPRIPAVRQVRVHLQHVADKSGASTSRSAIRSRIEVSKP